MIPCKRPKVTVEWHPMAGLDQNGTGTEGRHVVICHVPRCDFGRVYHVVKVAAQEEARWHRDAHRRGVPRAWIECDIEWDVHCEPCGGHRRTFGTRTDAQAWLDHHLSTEHGLVTC